MPHAPAKANKSLLCEIIKIEHGLFLHVTKSPGRSKASSCQNIRDGSLLNECREWRPQYHLTLMHEYRYIDL